MKFNKIFSVLACAALLAGTYACTDKVEPTPSPVAGNEEVYFPFEESANITIPVNATMISVTVNRVDASEESTVALASAVTYTNEDSGEAVAVTDIFTVPSSITFPKDVKQVTLEIGVDFEKVVMDREYNIDLTLDSSKTGSYGLGHKLFTATYLPWSEWELYSETEPGVYQMGAYWDYEYNTPVYTRKSLTTEGLEQYLVLSPFSNLDYEEVIQVSADQFVEVDGVQCPVVKLTEAINTTIVNEKYGQVYMYTTAYEYLNDYYEGGGAFPLPNGTTAMDAMQAQGWHLSYFNPVQGRFYLYMVLFIEDGFFGEYLETLQLPGEFNDYYFTFNYSGNFVDKTGAEYAYVEVVPSPDLDHFACEMVPGKLSAQDAEAACEALAEDDDAEMIYAGSYTMSYAFEEAGDYTAIAVGYDKNNKVVCTGYKNYVFETVQSESEWKKLGNVDYTDGFFVGLCLNKAAVDTYEVAIEERKDTPGYYRLVNPYAGWWVLPELGWPLLEGNYYIEIDAQDPEAVLLPLCELGVDCKTKISQSEMMGAAKGMSDGWYNINYGNSTLAQEKADGNVGVIADSRLTFPAASLLMVAGNGKNIFYANLDPDAPEGAPIDYGEGFFEVSFEPVYGVSAKKVHRNVKGMVSAVSMKRLLDARKKNAKAINVRKGHDLSQKAARELRLSTVKTLK
ncbi:MAG: hypothetical protein K2L96_03480 [Muribaculaceae bacterium]|nr:hypothetical protein [Muribaculaceae bacterium]